MTLIQLTGFVGAGGESFIAGTDVKQGGTDFNFLASMKVIESGGRINEQDSETNSAADFEPFVVELSAETRI